MTLDQASYPAHPHLPSSSHPQRPQLPSTTQKGFQSWDPKDYTVVMGPSVGIDRELWGHLPIFVQTPLALGLSWMGKSQLGLPL